MENKVLSANLNALKDYDSTLYNEILRTNDIKSSFELTKTSQDEYNLLFNMIPIHSDDGAIQEAKKIVSSVENIENKNAIRIIYGLGLGYLADEFIGATSANIIIYEPNLEILRTVLEIVEFDKNLLKKNVIICADKKKLLEWIDILADKETKITVSFLTSYLNLFKNDIYNCAKIVEYTRGEKQANLNTINKVASRAAINTVWAIKNIIKNPHIGTLKDAFKGKTAIIASAGPSLNENIEIIKQNRSKFILFAVGPSLRLLDNNGIKPDFLCMVEPLDTRGQIEGIDLSEVNLIFEPFSSTYLWKTKTKNKFLFFSKENYLNDWLAQILNIDNSNLKSVGTVSYCALSSAKTMGFKKIILCGQNLAFKSGQCYAKGSAYEALECVLNQNTNKFEIKIKDMEQYRQKLLGSKKQTLHYADELVKNYIKRLNTTLYSVMGQDGQMLPTQACYALFIKHFEEFAKNNKGIEYINCSSNGAQINGFNNLPLEKALGNETKAHCAEIPIKEPNYNLDRLNRAKEATIKVLLDAKTSAEDILNIQKEMLKEISRRKTLSKNTDKLEEKIEKILNDFEQKFYNNEVLYFLCTPKTNKMRENIKKQKSTKNINEYTDLNRDSIARLEALLWYVAKALYYLSDK